MQVNYSVAFMNFFPKQKNTLVDGECRSSVVIFHKGGILHAENYVTKTMTNVIIRCRTYSIQIMYLQWFSTIK